MPSVTVDVHLEDFTTEELVEELRDRKAYEDDVLEDFATEDLRAELRSRGQYSAWDEYDAGLEPLLREVFDWFYVRPEQPIPRCLEVALYEAFGRMLSNPIIEVQK